MGSRMSDRQIPWPRFTSDELAALIGYLSRH